MRIGVVVFPGSNCDRDAAHAMEQLGHEVVMLWHKDNAIANFTAEDCIILPGGFSFGDYLRSGAIARFSPIVGAIKKHARGWRKSAWNLQWLSCYVKWVFSWRSSTK